MLQRTAGHPLSVVESLRALGEGESGVPRTLAEAIALRAQRLEPQTRRVLELACVAGGRMDALRLAHMGDLTELAAVQECEELVRVRLMNRAGAEYEVVNDLVQESVHDALPPALAAALHRRAADAFSDRPEAMAAHAYAAGEPDRAAHGWWLAGREAMGRSAIDDAADLFDRSLQAGGDTSLRTRVLLARARAHEAAARYPEAIATSTPPSRSRTRWATAGWRWPRCGSPPATSRWRSAGRTLSSPRASRRGSGSPPGSVTGTPRPISRGGSPRSRPATCGSAVRWTPPVAT